MSLNRREHLCCLCEDALLLACVSMVRYASPVLERDVVAHFFVHLVPKTIVVTINVHSDIVCDLELLHHQQTSVVADQCLNLVCPVQAIDAVRADYTPLDLDFGCQAGSLLFGQTAKKLDRIKHFCCMFQHINLVSFYWVPLFRFHVPVDKLDA